MKNYTGFPITIELASGRRIVVQPEPITPRVSREEPLPLGVFGDIDIAIDVPHTVDWGGVAVDLQAQPIIVSREVFDLLPHDAVAFVTPDLGSSAIRNSFGTLFAITKLIAKPECQKYISAPSTSNINNQQ